MHECLGGYQMAVVGLHSDTWLEITTELLSDISYWNDYFLQYVKIIQTLNS